MHQRNTSLNVKTDGEESRLRTRSSNMNKGTYLAADSVLGGPTAHWSSHHYGGLSQGSEAQRHLEKKVAKSSRQARSIKKFLELKSLQDSETGARVEIQLLELWRMASLRSRKETQLLYLTGKVRAILGTRGMMLISRACIHNSLDPLFVKSKLNLSLEWGLTCVWKSSGLSPKCEAH